MNTETRELLEKVASWPEEDQRELAEAAAEIEARRSGIYRLTAEESAAIKQGLQDADAGRFVPEQEMKAFWARFDSK